MKNIIIAILMLGLAVNSYAGALDTWTNVATSPYGGFTYIAYGNGYYVATSVEPPTFPIIPPPPTGGISASTNGIDWVHQPINDNYVYGIVFGNNAFVIFTELNGQEYGLSSSTNGTNWVGGASFTNLSGVAFGNGVFAAVGYNNGKGMAYLSTNGQTWNTNSFEIASNFFPAGIAFGQGGFVVVGGQATAKTNNSVYFSTNGQTWSNISLAMTGTYAGIYSINNIFIAAAYTNEYVYYYYANTNLFSPWEPITPPLACTWQPVGENSSLYTSINNGNVSNIYSSSDYSTNWISHNTGFTNIFNCITYANGQFVAAGSGGGIFISGVVPPSISIQMQSNSGAELTISGGVGPTYHLQASTNLSTWTNLASFTNIGVSAQYLDSSAGRFTQRYYRSVSP